MSEHAREVIEYLTPRREAFWRWAGRPLSVAWRDGRTIAFRQELAEVLRHLAPQGLPPLGAVLMVLAACRENWGTGDSVAQVAAGYEGGFEDDLGDVERPAGLVISLVVPASVRSEIAGIVEDLDRVARLPAELRTSVRAKCAIVETVFEGVERTVKPEAARDIVRALAHGVDAETLTTVVAADGSFRQLAAELEALRVGLGRVDAERLRLRMTTGLDQGASAADLEVPDAVRVRQLLGRLQDDPELAGVTRVARELLAAIHVPRALAAPQELPVGGVSDLSNRGELDRLLVSELAQDDLTLMTRVALNEALYLRREAPRHSPPRDRVIVIDTGVRMWGVPRVFATSVGLALAASGDKGARVRCFRPTPGGVEVADLGTRDGLVAQLAAIGAAPQPGKAVRAVMAQFADEGEDGEVIVVTHEDAAGDPDFVRTLDEVDRGRDWQVATVGRDGSFRLMQVGRGGRRTICSARLSLDTLLAEKKEKRSAPIELVDKGVDRTLPVILSTEPFPLLLPARADARRAVGSKRFGLIGVTHDRRLMRWRSEQQGAEQLVAAVPPGTGMGVFVDEEEGVVFCVSHDTPAGGAAMTHVLVGRPEGGGWRERLMTNGPLRAAAHHGGVVLLMYDRRVTAVSAEGKVVADRAVPMEFKWHSGRFYRHPADVGVFSGNFACSGAHFDGRDVAFAHVTGRESLVIFDRTGHGPWMLLHAGHVASASGPPLIVKNPPFFPRRDRCRVSHDGNRIFHRDRGNRMSDLLGHFLDLDARPLKWGSVHPDAEALLVGEDFRRSSLCGLNIVNRFDSVYVEDSGDLVLRTAYWRRAIRLTSSGHLALEFAGRRDGSETGAVAFRPVRGRKVAGRQFQLREARWPDGSRAILDSRGMLHLQGTAPGLPEITLVLTDQTIGGWTSDGLTFGRQFFHREAPTAPAEYVYGLLRSFAGRVR